MEALLVFAIVFLAIFTQSLTGFGLALVSMPLLTSVLGVGTAAPLVALIALVAEAILLLYFRQALSLTVIWRLALASVFGVPVGVLGLRIVDERLVLGLLGFVLAGYALYGLFSLRLPRLQHTLWAYGAGFLAGILGGAYNTSGPPVIVYGHSRRWAPSQFKANLQGFFLLNSAVVLVGHLLAGNMSPAVWRGSLSAAPAVPLGILAGLYLDRHIDPQRFRQLVLIVLFFLGLRLLLG
ncbi:MAG: sulfite exporter TauE/SafE family protein [Candidatus Promineifilaceae bacterium]|nr:sulfite exporter TauE/SafE family protein [Candidatus Promineifilaceae bacterium]